MNSQSITGRELCVELYRCFDVKFCGGSGALVSPREGWEECLDGLSDVLVQRYGVQPKLVATDEGLGVVFIRVKRGWGWLRVLVFLAATIAAVAIAGFEVAGQFASVAHRLGVGVNILGLTFAFLLGLLGPLAVHEGGHYLAARRRGVPVSPPLFIPAPPPNLGGIGTFGAIILMRGVPKDRDSLALVGLSGPLYGFVAGVVVALAGLVYSLVVSNPAVARSVAGSTAPVSIVPLILVLEGSLVLKGEGLVILHPLAVAAYIVFLVTFLNLLPIGWLDGGHVVYAVFGERVHRVTSTLTPWVAIIASLVYPQMLFVGVFSLLAYGLYLVLSRGMHPGVVNPFRPLSPRRAALYAGIYTLLLVLTLPVPV